MKSNLFRWSGRRGRDSWEQFPEVDRAGWFTIDEARQKILKGQEPFPDRLLDLMKCPALNARGLYDLIYCRRMVSAARRFSRRVSSRELSCFGRSSP